MLVGEFVRQTLVTMPLETAPALGFSHTLARRRSRDFIEMVTLGYKPQRLFRQTFLIERQGLEPFLNSTLGVGCWALDVFRNTKKAQTDISSPAPGIGDAVRS